MLNAIRGNMTPPSITTAHKKVATTEPNVVACALQDDMHDSPSALPEVSHSDTFSTTDSGSDLSSTTPPNHKEIEEKTPGIIDVSSGPRSSDFLNAPTQYEGVVQVQGNGIPWTISTPNYADEERCYTVSPYAHYIGYAYDEIRLRHHHHAAAAGGNGLSIRGAVTSLILWCISHLVRWLKIDKVIYFNNWLLSTNLWPNSIKWSAQQVHATNQELHKVLQQLPSKNNNNRAIIWRSVDPLSQPELTQVLSSSSRACVMLPARIANWVDLSDIPTLLQKKYNLKRDLKLVQQKVGWDIIEQKNVEPKKASSSYPYVMQQLSPEQMTLEMANQIIDLYNELYLEKYSKRNPQFTAAGIRRLVRTGHMTLVTLTARSDPNKIVVFVLSTEMDGVITCPLIGYDMKSTDKTLYRLCTMLELNEALRRGHQCIHLSAGANEFKRHRGAVSTVEYSAVFIDHLPWYQQFLWRMLKAVTDKVITVKRAN